MLCVAQGVPLQHGIGIASYTDASQRELRRMETRENEDTSTVIATLGEIPLSAQTHMDRKERMALAKKSARRSSIASAAAAKAPAWARTQLPVLRKARLFSGLNEDEILAALPCLGARERRYDVGERLLNAGDVTSHVFVMLEGQINIIREDWWGNRSIVSIDGPSDSFAEAYACPPGSRLTVSVVATRKVRVLTFEIRAIMEICRASCPFHNRLMQNLVSTIAEQNLRLNDMLSFVTRRTTREKLLAYLGAESQRQGSRSFTIPFDRQQLADFLSVNRSAVSTELGKLRKDGIIDFDRSHFTLLDSNPLTL